MEEAVAAGLCACLIGVARQAAPSKAASSRRTPQRTLIVHRFSIETSGPAQHSSLSRFGKLRA